MPSEDLSTSEKLLVAAFQLEQSGKLPFSAEDLVVSAWKRYPDVFGLAGYRDEAGRLAYPNSNRVYAEVMGSKPLRKNGFLKKVGSKMYELTESGRAQAAHLLSSPPGRSVQKIALHRDIEVHLKRLFASKAFDKMRNNRVEDITFLDACAFWGISPRSSAIDLEGKMANFTQVVETAKTAVKEKRVSFEHGGHAFDTADLDLLLHVHRTLVQRYADEISLIEQRRDERIV